MSRILKSVKDDKKLLACKKTLFHHIILT